MSSSVLADLRSGRDPCKQREFTYVRLQATYPGGPTTPSLVRRAIRGALREVAYPETSLADIEYAVNELVTNCVVHAPGSTVRVCIVEETVRRILTCVVCDDGPGQPVIRLDTECQTPLYERQSGYGLDSVAVPAARMECRPCVHDKAVGFQYRTAEA